MPKLNLLNFTPDKLAEYFCQINEKSFHSIQIIKWIHQLGIIDISKMSNLSLKLRNHLLENCEIIFPEIAQEQLSSDGTIKWLLKLEDNNFIEMVFIPPRTLCISSQVGCPLACAFCATGALGYTRNLTVAEIIGQLWLAVRRLSPDKTSRSSPITNVVFMGMGEPLLNYGNVVGAAKLMLDDNVYGLSKYKVTISTCGLVPQLIDLQKQSEVALAVSLHAPTNELRSKLMPINSKYPLEMLLSVCNTYYVDKRRMVTIEYIMLDGVNDGNKHAQQLVKLLSGGRYKINLIPGNIVHNSLYKPSSMERINEFRDILLNHGFMAITRKPRGSDIMASCGQLAGKCK